MKLIQVSNLIISLLGIGISIYAYYVESVKQNDPDYEAMCDISEHISCSKVFTSPYGKGFGFLKHFVASDSILLQPNSVYGFVYYPAQIILGESNSLFAAKVQVLLNAFGVLGCVYLAYLLMFVLEDFCVVCVTTYLLITLLLITSLVRVGNLKRSTRPVPKAKKN